MFVISVVEVLDERVTHVVVDPRDVTRVTDIRHRLRGTYIHVKL